MNEETIPEKVMNMKVKGKHTRDQDGKSRLGKM
jgi:hypothetical protein